MKKSSDWFHIFAILALLCVVSYFYQAKPSETPPTPLNNQTRPPEIQAESTADIQVALKEIQLAWQWDVEHKNNHPHPSLHEAEQKLNQAMSDANSGRTAEAVNALQSALLLQRADEQADGAAYHGMHRDAAIKAATTALSKLSPGNPLCTPSPLKMAHPTSLKSSLQRHPMTRSGPDFL